MSNLKVAVRIRPMSERELVSQSVSAVSVDNGVVSVTNMKVPAHHAGDSRERVRKFTFDYCFDEDSTQDEIFSMVEEEVANALSSRYHACVLAYGQSSTGKTYTMMGLQDEPGLTPRLCENIFKYFQSSVTEDEMKNMHTSVSYLEIYNERVQDLLTSGNTAKSLRVREHPKRGPYVQGLTEHRVQNSTELLTWLSTGNGNRRVAATSNNRRSSRSHSVFTVSSGQGTASSCCRLHLVDLAGSERAHSATPEHSTPRLKEGANINRSLVALGNVICALSEPSGKTRHSRKRFVPYRDSVLTWLLKETLGGNSKSVMVATISPSSVCYSETVNTLRFGQRAKQIVNRPVVNEDAKEKLIRELRTEIARLRELLYLQNGSNTRELQLEINVDSSRCTEMTDPLSDQKAEINNEESTEPELEEDTIDRVASIENVSELENISENPPVQEHFQKETQNSVDTTSHDEHVAKDIVDSPTTQVHIQTDSLIPVIDVTSSVKPRQLQPTRLNRTYSVEFPRSAISKLRKDFGSHETLPSTVSVKPSMNKPVKQSKETAPKASKVVEVGGKVEKPAETSSRSGSISESSGKSTPKQNATRKTHRREVVAAVTQRLYSQQARKLTGEDKSATTDLSILPRQTLCSSARMRLQELTQRALRASKRKTHSETQTEPSSTVRLKEKSTDVQDIEVALLEVKHATVEATVDVQTVGVSCHVENYNQTLKLTRSCSSQTEQQKAQSVSFTKYLQNPPLAIHSYSQPIYTSSVNINVSHNYPCQRDEVSDDSLEDCHRHNVQYSTPDLISNHNSLEQNVNQKPVAKSEAESAEAESHATVDKFPDKFYVNEYFATDSAEYCFADTSLVPPIDETVNDVSVPVVRAAEIRQMDEFSESCMPFRACEIKLVKPVQTFETFKAVKPKGYLAKSECKKLKSIIKPKNNLSPTPADCSTEESDTDSSNFGNKRVRFSPHIRRTDMFGVLQSFMDEASSLLCKLNVVAKHVEQAEDLRNRRACHSRQRTNTERDKKECYVQTYLPLHDAASQTSPARDESLLDLSDSEISENKWEKIVKTSCDKLEQCIRLAEHKSREDERRKQHTSFDNECLHKFPQPFSSDTDWKYCPTDYSSLETTHSASDYGSLPRRDGQFRRSPYKNYSPKAYMKQLVALRKQIVETSRNDLMEELRVPLPNH